MIQVTYSSIAAETLGSDGLFEIIEKSARNNMRDDLTGFLILSGNRFFQLIEGSEQAIDGLLAKLHSDARHTDITIVHRTGIETRDFPKWKMKRVVPRKGSSNLPPDIEGFENVSRAAKIAIAEFLMPPFCNVICQVVQKELLG